MALVNHKARIAYMREYNRRTTASNIRFTAAVKTTVGCKDCGYDKHPTALDFDHIEPKVKNVSDLVRDVRRNLARIVEEIDKCDVVCANCHRIRHAT